MEDPLRGDVVINSFGGATYAMGEEGAEVLLREEVGSTESNIHEDLDEEDSLSQYLSDGDEDELAGFEFPDFKKNLNSAICIQNLPITTQAEKHIKLMALVLRLCRKIDESVVEDNIYLPSGWKTDNSTQVI